MKTHIIGSTKIRMGIRGKLLGIMLPAAAAIIAVILLLVYFNTKQIVLKKSEQTLLTSSQSVVNKVEAWMNEAITALEVERDAIEYFAMEPDKELAYIRHTVNQYEAFPAGIYFATTQGRVVHSSFVPGPEYNLSQKTWYIEGLKSEQFTFGAVQFDESSKSYVVGASGQLKDKNGTVVGVAAADITLNAISQIVQEVQLEKTGGVFLVDSLTKTIIGHKDPAMVGAKLDNLKDPVYQYVAVQVGTGAVGLSSYTSTDENSTYINLGHVPNSNWMSVAYVPQHEVLEDLNVLTRNILFLAGAAIVLLALMIAVMVRLVIIRPVRAIDYVACKIAGGDLDQCITYRSGDEFGSLAANFNLTVERLRSYIGYIDEISKILNEIARGNLSFSLMNDYTGEFAKVKDALQMISKSLNDTITQINAASGEVSAGAEQVSCGAQTLSQGTTEQAGSIEELASSINEVSGRISENAQAAQLVKLQTDKVGDEIAESNRRMQEMSIAINQISTKSSEIGKIVKTIEDISFQTNILALNAAVEAARAGVAGKGFAVVADEVRNLANKSAQAAKSTTVLIEETVQAVENGELLAKATAESMLAVVENAKLVTNLMDQIVHASVDQATSVALVTAGIEQISVVVQANSATAEQSAAASEVMASQAQALKGLVGRFELKKLDREKKYANR